MRFSSDAALWLIRLGTVAGPASLLGCNQSCATVALPAITLSLEDGETKQPICDAVVIASDGAVTARLQPRPGNVALPACAYDGLSNRPGEYEISISHPRYERVELHSVEVHEGDHGCGIEPALLHVDLVRIR